MKEHPEIGGYFELERNRGSLWHDHALALNCARACLAYLIKLHGIAAVLLPDYMCDVVPDVFNRYGVEVRTYQIGCDFLPVDQLRLNSNEWLYLNDYYGQLTADDIEEALALSDGKLIVDEVQNYFARPYGGVDTLYSCRKFFGVSDGAFLYADASLYPCLSLDSSLGRMSQVLGRFEFSSGDFFSDAQRNNDALGEDGIRKMSPITENLLRGIDYHFAIDQRNANYRVLAESLDPLNTLDLVAPDGPFAYPLLVDDGPHARKALAAHGVFVPTLWPNVLDEVDPSTFAYRYAKDILPLPVDQRYGREEMEYIVSMLHEEKIV